MDSIAGVALKYGISLADLRRANHLWASDSIHLRKVLYIPFHLSTRKDLFYPTNVRILSCAMAKLLLISFHLSSGTWCHASNRRRITCRVVHICSSLSCYSTRPNLPIGFLPTVVPTISITRLGTQASYFSFSNSHASASPYSLTDSV